MIRNAIQGVYTLWQWFTDSIYNRLRRSLSSLARPRGRFHVEIVRQGRVIYAEDFDNGIVDEGLNYLLEAGFFNAATGVDTWFIGLVNNSGFTSFSNGDTLASHGGWTEFTAYDEVNRVSWGPGTPASRAITNTTPAAFTINSSGTLKGILVASVNTGTAGILWSTAAFASPVAVVSTDEVNVTYTVSG